MSPDKDNRSTAEVVRELRGDLSHDRFAAELGTTRQTVIRWEKGTIPRSYAQALSEFSGGRYPPEFFDPRLGEGSRSVPERLAALEEHQLVLEQRLQKLERAVRRSGGRRSPAG